MIRRGSVGPEVVAWQKVLGITPDGVFGAQTEAATRAWQAAHGLVADGIVGPDSLHWAGFAELEPKPGNPDGLPYEFVQARCFRPVGRAKVDRVHIHTTEGHERPGQARVVATMFHLPTSPQAAAHFVVDSAETIQLVRECDLAWDSGSSSWGGISVEHVGTALQSALEWDDDYSRAVLDRSARLVAGVCKRWSIPVVRLSPTEIAAGARGIAGHRDLNLAHKEVGGHVDPGPNFPWAAYLKLVEAYSVSSSSP
jgi:hypothetical protein